VLARTVPTGAFPHAVAFSVAVAAEHAAAVTAAFGGRTGCLLVRYLGLRWEPWAGTTRVATTWRTTGRRTTADGVTTADTTRTLAASAATPDLPALPPVLEADAGLWFGPTPADPTHTPGAQP
jgi:hypothetical protein